MNENPKDIESSLKKASRFDQFNVITVDLMIELYRNNALSEKVVDCIHKLNLWYYTILEKIYLLEEEANIDAKTGLLKYNEHYLEKLLKVASRTIEKLDKGFYHITYIRIDIDDFSYFNNKYGHSIGDIVLKEVAYRIRKLTRPTDYCIRYGGEEFDIFLSNTDLKGAYGFAEKFYKAIEGLSIEVEGQPVKITVSMGGTILKVGGRDIQNLDTARIKSWYDRLQEEVDDALYKAKYLGKNRFFMYDPKEKLKYKEYRTKYTQGKQGF